MGDDEVTTEISNTETSEVGVVENVLMSVLIVCSVSVICAIILSFIIAYQKYVANKNNLGEGSMGFQRHKITVRTAA